VGFDATVQGSVHILLESNAGNTLLFVSGQVAVIHDFAINKQILLQGHVSSLMVSERERGERREVLMLKL